VLFDVLTDFEVDVELIKGEGFDVDDERTEEDALFELLLVAEDFVVERSEDEELLDVLVLDDFVVEEKSSDVEELFEVLVLTGLEDDVESNDEDFEDETLFEVLELTDFDVEVESIESVEDFEMLEDTDLLVDILLEAADDSPNVPFLI
jgi:hypothetical protein